MEQRGIGKRGNGDGEGGTCREVTIGKGEIWTEMERGWGKGQEVKMGKRLGMGDRGGGGEGEWGGKSVTLGLDFPATSRKDRVLGPGLYIVYKYNKKCKSLNLRSTSRGCLVHITSYIILFSSFIGEVYLYAVFLVLLG